MPTPAAALVAVLLAGAPAAPAAPDAVELTALLKTFLAGASRNDYATHERFWAEDLVYTRSAGRRVGKADILRELRSAAAPAGEPATYTAEDIQVHQYGDTAVVAFRLVATSTPNGPVTEYLDTGTFVKREGRWQAVAWQATRVPPAETETPAAPAAGSHVGRSFVFDYGDLAIRVRYLSDTRLEWEQVKGPQAGEKAEEQYGSAPIGAGLVFFWWQEKDSSVVSQVVDFAGGRVHTTWTSADKRLAAFQGQVRPLP